MSSFAQNALQAVQTYQPAALGYMLNECCFLNTANLKFQNFQNEVGNLGTAVSLQLPYKFSFAEGLAPSWQPITQRLTQLVCDQSGNVSISTTNQQRIFNFDASAEEFTTSLAKGAIVTLGNSIETNIGLNFVSGVVNKDPSSANFGSLNTFSGPYRFFGNGSTALSSFQQLATMQMFYKNFGSANGKYNTYLPDYVIPGIVSSGLNQFASARNDEIADSWMVGTFGSPPVNYYQSNLLPTHLSGNVGVAGTVLTVVSTNDPTGQNVTQITFSGATNNDANAIYSGDMAQFNDGVSGKANLRFLTFVNNGVSESVNPVQFRVTANAAANGSGQVTVTLSNALNWAGGQNKNINHAIEAGMQVTFLPDHRAGCVINDDAFYVAMPQLPDQSPFYSASKYDEETGASICLSYGALFNENQMGFKFMGVWGSLVVPDYSMRVIVPVSQ